jgi:MFS family permease
MTFICYPKCTTWKLSVQALRKGFPALGHRNFRLFWFGQCISLVGTWMQTIGQSWLVLQLTNSALKLSLVSTIQFLPMMVFALFAGTLVDKFPKRRVLIITQTCFAILAAVLASLTYFHVVQYWHILVLAFLLGVINTIDMPTRQSFFVEMVGKEDLMNAIALNSSIFNLARIIGPAVAGLLIGLFGIAICFYLNALSFVAVIAGLWMIRIPVKLVQKQAGAFQHILPDVREGLRYIGQNKAILQPLLLMAIISAFVMNFNVLIPVYATQNLGSNATEYGFLMTCMGIGSFLGAVIIAAKSKSGPKLKFLVAGALGMSVFLALLGFEKNYVIACITLFVIGLCSIVFTTMVNTTIQINSADHMRGRVMSVYSLVFGGVIPIGSLIAGNVSEHTGAPNAMIIFGVIGILSVSCTIYLMRKHNPDAGTPAE